jgi:hypothetical protein
MLDPEERAADLAELQRLCEKLGVTVVFPPQARKTVVRKGEPEAPTWGGAVLEVLSWLRTAFFLVVAVFFVGVTLGALTRLFTFGWSVGQEWRP